MSMDDEDIFSRRSTFCQLENNINPINPILPFTNSQILNLIKFNLLKHNSTIEEYNTKVINDIIYDEKKHIVSIFKDFLLIDEVTDFVNRFYSKEESPARIYKFCRYYANQTHKTTPTYAKLDAQKILNKNIKRKRKIMELLQEQKELEEENRDCHQNEYSIFINPEIFELDNLSAINGQNESDMKIDHLSIESEIGNPNEKRNSIHPILEAIEISLIKPSEIAEMSTFLLEEEEANLFTKAQVPKKSEKIIIQDLAMNMGKPKSNVHFSKIENITRKKAKLENVNASKPVTFLNQGRKQNQNQNEKSKQNKAISAKTLPSGINLNLNPRSLKLKRFQGSGEKTPIKNSNKELSNIQGPVYNISLNANLNVKVNADNHNKKVTKIKNNSIPLTIKCSLTNKTEGHLNVQSPPKGTTCEMQKMSSGNNDGNFSPVKNIKEDLANTLSPKGNSKRETFKRPIITSIDLGLPGKKVQEKRQFYMDNVDRNRFSKNKSSIFLNSAVTRQKISLISPKRSSDKNDPTPSVSITCPSEWTKREAKDSKALKRLLISLNPLKRRFPISLTLDKNRFDQPIIKSSIVKEPAMAKRRKSSEGRKIAKESHLISCQYNSMSKPLLSRGPISTRTLNLKKGK